MARPAIEDYCSICELDIDDFTNGTVWFFTWNPADRYFKNQDYYYKWADMILRVLKDFSRCMLWYACMPEISDTGRLHCHGWFVIKDKVKWLKSVHPRLKKWGNLRMRKQKFKHKGFYYYKKDIEETAEIIGADYLPFCHYNNEDVIKAIKDKAFATIKKDDIKSMDITLFF